MRQRGQENILNRLLAVAIHVILILVRCKSRCRRMCDVLQPTVIEIIVDGIKKNSYLKGMYGWDYWLPELLKRPFIQSKIKKQILRWLQPYLV